MIVQNFFLSKLFLFYSSCVSILEKLTIIYFIISHLFTNISTIIIYTIDNNSYS